MLCLKINIFRMVTFYHITWIYNPFLHFAGLPLWIIRFNFRVSQTGMRHFATYATVAKCRKMSQNITKCRKMLQNVALCRKMSHLCLGGTYKNVQIYKNLHFRWKYRWVKRYANLLWRARVSVLWGLFGVPPTIFIRFSITYHS